MTRRLIDVDEEKLEAVRALLGTATLDSTVDEALNEVLALAGRRRALLAERGIDALADPVNHPLPQGAIFAGEPAADRADELLRGFGED